MKTVVALLALLVAITNLSAAPELRYKTALKQTNVYSVQIETQSEAGRETLAGNIFVTAKTGSKDVVTLGFRGSLTPKRQSPPMPQPGGFYRPTMPVYLNEGCELQIDSRGRVVREAGDYTLAVPLGQLAHALIETLPAEPSEKWEQQDSVSVFDDPLALGPAAVLSQSPGLSPYYSGYYPGRSGPAVLAANRRVTYHAASVSSNAVTIQKKLALDTLAKTGTEPRISASGEGELVFDTDLGLVRKIDMDYKASISTETVVRRNTLAFHARLLAGEELATALIPARPSPDSQITTSPGKKLTADELNKLIAEIKSDEPGKRLMALSRLRSAEIESVPRELLVLMEKLSFESDSSTRSYAAYVLAKHATKEYSPALIKLLKDQDFSVRDAAINGVARLKEKKAIAPLVEVVATGSSFGSTAESALAKFGADAEPEVLGLLKEKNANTLRQACNILKQIGTSKSVEPLKKLVLHPDRQVSDAAAEALRAINLRN